MTLHMKSIIEFAQLFNELTGNVVSGQPLAQSLELIRGQFSACGALLVIDHRARTGEANYFFYTDGKEICAPQADQPGAGSAQLLANLKRQSQHISAHYTSADQATRYTLWLFRDRDADEFDHEETVVADIIIIQLARSIELAWRVGVSEVERTLYSDVLERLNIGVMVLDFAGRVLRISPIADRFLNEREGLCIQGGKLRALAAREDKALQEAIKASQQEHDGCETEKPRGLSLTKRSGTKNLGVIVRRIASAARAGTGQSVAVYVRDSEVAQELEGDLVRQILDLTPAEAAVARRLTEGLSLDDAASSLDISRNTARAHLRSIFSKSGITRQTELVRLVLNSAAMLGERPSAAV